MSKLITGQVKIESFEQVKEACKVLGWLVEERGEGVRVHIIAEGARYHTYIDVSQTGQLHYDNWMGAAGEDLHSEEHRQGKEDTVTARVIGQFKQAVARVRMEGMLKAHKASWRVKKRQDGAQVLVVRRG